MKKINIFLTCLFLLFSPLVFGKCYVYVYNPNPSKYNIKPPDNMRRYSYSFKSCTPNNPLTSGWSLDSLESWFKYSIVLKSDGTTVCEESIKCNTKPFFQGQDVEVQGSCISTKDGAGVWITVPGETKDPKARC